MGRQIVKQPNGKYAIWSSVVDDFVIIECADAAEIIEALVEDARADISRSVNDVIAKLHAGQKPYYQHTKTFADCMEIIREVHGESRVGEVMREFSVDRTED